FGHFQQEGFKFAEKGDSIAFIDRSSLQTVLVAQLETIDFQDENRYIMTFDRDLSPIRNIEVAIQNKKRGADIEIMNCQVRKNRARSILISTDGNAIVQNCDFASMMAGIRICGDANYWFESGPISNVIIRRNTFRGLGSGGWSPQAVLQVDPVIPSSSRNNSTFYHGKITFEDNTIYSSESQLVYCLSVQDLTISNNKFISQNEIQRFPGLSVIDVQYCGNVDISNNDFSKWKEEAAVSIHGCSTDKVHLYPQIKTVDNPNRYYYEN
ncbi:MAG: right-handed parallel beta-helix repeat-containing protein, partial [Candidatus Cryptobacteroides sp.]